MAERVASCIWKVDNALINALEEHLGTPVDSYVNGSQTWLRDVEGSERTIEWRLHPVVGFELPGETSHYELWEAVLSSESTSPTAFWDGLECFVAFGDDLEPSTLAGVAQGTLNIAPDAYGMVDHEQIGDAWERANGKLSITDALLEQLRA